MARGFVCPLASQHRHCCVHVNTSSHAVRFAQQYQRSGAQHVATLTRKSVSAFLDGRPRDYGASHPPLKAFAHSVCTSDQTWDDKHWVLTFKMGRTRSFYFLTHLCCYWDYWHNEKVLLGSSDIFRQVSPSIPCKGRIYSAAHHKGAIVSAPVSRFFMQLFVFMFSLCFKCSSF